MFDTIIIGAGPAGMSAALYLLREGKKVLLIEKETIGGQIAESPRLENYPSIKSISGMDFASNLFDQISFPTTSYTPHTYQFDSPHAKKNNTRKTIAVMCHI